MSVSLFEWRALTEAINNIRPSERFILNTVFSKPKQHATNVLDIEIISGGRKLAPFVAPIEGGIVVDKLGRSVQTVKFPKIRMKKPLSAKELLAEKNLGQIYVGGAGDINSYRQQKIAEELLDLKERANRRLEWMAAKSLTGKLQVDQENISFEIDFRMDAENKPVLAGAALWSNADADPLKDLRAWKRIILNKTGKSANKVILGTDAAEAFLSNLKVLKYLDNNNISVGRIQVDNSNYLGRFVGLDLYEYNEQYVDDSGNVQDMISSKVAIVIATSARFDLHYGPIYDTKAGNVVQEYFSKMWEEEDPSGLWLLAETNPLTVPHEPNAAVYATVI